MIGKQHNHQENQLADAYLRGVLTPDEIEKFEIQLMDDQKLQFDLELCIALREGLELTHIEDAAASYSAGENKGISIHGNKSWLGNMLQAWRQSRHWLMLSTTAGSSLAVGALAALLFVQSNSSSVRDVGTVIDTDHILSDVPIMTFSRLRSATTNSSYSYVIDSASLESEIAVLELEVEFPTQSQYRVMVAAQSDSQVNPVVVSVKPNDRGYLVVALPSSYFVPGDYLISITPGINTTSSGGKGLGDIVDATLTTTEIGTTLDYSLHVNSNP